MWWIVSLYLPGNLGNTYKKTGRSKMKSYSYTTLKHYIYKCMKCNLILSNISILSRWIRPRVIVQSSDCVLNIQVRCRVPGNCRLKTQTAARLRGSVTLSQVRLQAAAAAAVTHPSLQRSFSAAPSQKVQFTWVSPELCVYHGIHLSCHVSPSHDIVTQILGPTQWGPACLDC